MTALAFALALAACQTTITPRAGSEIVEQDGVVEIAPPGSNIVERDGAVEITPRAEPERFQPVCLVRARFFRGLVGVRCADLAQEIRP